jgi:methyl-accepting chemotaxis protein
MITGLNVYMLLVAMDKRNFFLDAMTHLGKDIKDAYVVRGEPVIRQFGPPRDKENPRDRLDELVLKEGKPIEVLKESLEGVEYRRAVPLLAKDYGNINCMTCHMVKEGEVLGVITVKLDIRGLQSYFLRVGTLPLSVLIGITLLMLFNKYIDIFPRLMESMKSLASGNFSQRLAVRLKDEVG